MKNNRRFVFDTNIVISAALFFDSVPGRAFQWARQNGTLLVSLALAQELNDVFSREKFERYVTRAEREKFLGVLLRDAEFVESDETIQICRDPKDNALLETAVNGNADVLVSGDQDLRVLNPFREILILTPSEFLARFVEGVAE